MSKHLIAQMKSRILDLFDPIYITVVLGNFKLTSDTNGVYEVAAILLFKLFLEEFGIFSTKHQAGRKTRGPDQHAVGKTTTLKTISQDVSYLTQKTQHI